MSELHSLADAKIDAERKKLLASLHDQIEAVKVRQSVRGSLRSGNTVVEIVNTLPKFASNNRAEGTAEENKAVVSKSIAMIGTYSVNAADKTLTFKVDSATFPNWNGTEQKRLLSSSNKDEIKYNTPTASSGGVATVIWTRAK